MGKLLPNPDNCGQASVYSDPAGFCLESGSASMRPVEAVIRELAQSDVPVLLLAEPGAGKHTTARRIHQMSRRSAQPFCWLSCATLKPEELAVASAHGGGSAAGTIFLDELADLNSACQMQLRDLLLQDPARGIQARIICGSSRDLEVEVKAGRLREDLYYRISGVCLRLPPLRQRKEDIPQFVAHFLGRYGRELHSAVPDLSAETLRLFQDYSWPGNLHELAEAARVLVALGNEQLAMEGLRARLHRAPAKGNGHSVSLKAASRAASHVAEKELILNVLTRTRWNRRRAAQELQISYKALLYKLKQIGYEGYGTT